MTDAARPMVDADFAWAAALMEQRRARYEQYSAVFWKPAVGITELHAAFMRGVGASPGAHALRTDHGFVLSSPNNGRCFIDDFATEADEQWATDGHALLLAAWERAEEPQVRVVTARLDEPKRAMLIDAGLTVGSRWWVKPLVPTGDATTYGPVSLGESDAVIIPVPPVYAATSPACLMGDADATKIDALCAAAARLGVGMAIVQRENAPPDTEPALEAAGFTNPSEFYDGTPA